MYKSLKLFLLLVVFLLSSGSVSAMNIIPGERLGAFEGTININKGKTTDIAELILINEFESLIGFYAPASLDSMLKGEILLFSNFRCFPVTNKYSFNFKDNFNKVLIKSTKRNKLRAAGKAMLVSVQNFDNISPYRGLFVASSENDSGILFIAFDGSTIIQDSNQNFYYGIIDSNLNYLSKFNPNNISIKISLIDSENMKIESKKNNQVLDEIIYQKVEGCFEELAG